MKQLLTLLTCVLLVLPAKAQDLSLEQARAIASRFERSASDVQRAPSKRRVSPLTLRHRVPSGADEDKTNLYVFDTNEGFVIVAGRQDAEAEVLGWSDNGTFDYTNAPPQLLEWIESWSRNIDSLRTSSTRGATHPRRAAASGKGYEVVSPLIHTTWGQWSPYNDLCPKGCPTGCVITAIAQVMNYWQWPDRGFGTNTHEGIGVTVDFSQSAYDWEHMCDDYSDRSAHSTEENAAVAKLMFDVGIACNAGYDPSGTVAGVWGNVLSTYFRYDPDLKRPEYTADIATFIKAELDQHRPVLYAAYPDEGRGHALVCDGYNSEGYFHFNYGWSGMGDGWFRLGALPDYNNEINLLGGIQPYGGNMAVVDGITYGLSGNGEAELLSCPQTSGTVVFPDEVVYDGTTYTVTRIGHGVLTPNRKYDKVVIGNHIRSIGAQAFTACLIDTLVLGDAVEEVGYQAFAASGVRNLTIGRSVKYIGKSAFYTCPLTTITCLSEAFEVDDDAFGYTSVKDGEWLKSITRLGDRALGATKISNPVFGKLTSIGSRALASNSLGTVTFPATLRHVAPDIFWGCIVYEVSIDDDNPCFSVGRQDIVHKIFILNKAQNSLVCIVPAADIAKSYVVPDGVVRVEPGAVPYSAQSIRLPASVVELDGAFDKCENLRSITLPAIVPPVVSDDCFPDKLIDDNNLSVYIPQGCYDDYRAAPGWRRCRIVESGEYDPLAVPAIGYNMVVNMHEGSSMSCAVDDVKRMTLNGEHLDVDGWTASVNDIDSITWQYDFIYGQEESFLLDDSTLTAEAQGCTIVIDATVIDGETPLAVRSSLACPTKIEGARRGEVVDVCLGNDVHALTGTAEIRIPIEVNDDEQACAAWYNTDSGQWEPVNGYYDAASGELRISTNHLSTFGAFVIEKPYSADARIVPQNNATAFALPTVGMSVSQAAENLKKIAESYTPESTAADLYASDLGEALGLINDMSWNSLQAMGFESEFLSDFSDALGYFGIALTTYQVARAHFNNQDEQVAAGTLRVVLNVAQTIASKVLSSRIMSASMAAVAFIDYSLTKFGEEAISIRHDQYQRAFDYYYSKEGRGTCYGGDTGRGFRTTVDWYNEMYAIISRTDLDEAGLQAAISANVDAYCNQLWNDNDALTTCLLATGSSSAVLKGLTESIRAELTNRLRADLYNGVLVSVFQAVKKHKENEACEQAFKDFKTLCNLLNRQVRIRVIDSQRDDDNHSSLEGLTVRFANINDEDVIVSDPKQWQCIVDEYGHGNISFTAYAYMASCLKPELVLLDNDDKPLYRYPFTMDTEYGNSKYINVTLDLRQNGIEVPVTDEWSFSVDPCYVLNQDGEAAHIISEELGLYDGIKEALSDVRTLNTADDGSFLFEAEGVQLSGVIDVKTKTGTGTFTIDTHTEYTHPDSEEHIFDFFASAVQHTDWEGEIPYTLKEYTASHKLQGRLTIGYSERANKYVVRFEGEGNCSISGSMYCTDLSVWDTDEDGNWYYTSKSLSTSPIHLDNARTKMDCELLYE